MKTLILSLKGPLRSWGSMSLGDDRWTDMRPTASGVLGLLGACAGIDSRNTDLVAQWYHSWSVITASATDWTRDGRRLSRTIRQDYQTAHNSLKMDGSENTAKGEKVAVVSLRGYLENARDVVAVTLRDGASEALYDLAVRGLAEPVYTPSIGRRSNPMSEPPLNVGDAWDPQDLNEVMGRLLGRLATPGLMEARVQINATEVTCDAGRLDAWVREWRRESGDRAPATRQGAHDDRMGAQMNYALRSVDLIRLSVPLQPLGTSVRREETEAFEGAL